MAQGWLPPVAVLHSKLGVSRYARRGDVVTCAGMRDSRRSVAVPSSWRVLDMRERERYYTYPALRLIQVNYISRGVQDQGEGQHLATDDGANICGVFVSLIARTGSCAPSASLPEAGSFGDIHSMLRKQQGPVRCCRSPKPNKPKEVGIYLAHLKRPWQCTTCWATPTWRRLQEMLPAACA